MDQGLFKINPNAPDISKINPKAPDIAIVVRYEIIVILSCVKLHGWPCKIKEQTIRKWCVCGVTLVIGPSIITNKIEMNAIDHMIKESNFTPSLQINDY